MNNRTNHIQHIVTALLLYTVFVVYGSLVPFEYRAHTLDQALVKFSRIPWLTLDDTSRADWVANLILYVPLAFLACTAFIRSTQSSFTKHLRIYAILVFCLLLAITVEFTQIFFAPRTVSLNDLLAEGLGSLLGILSWIIGRHRFSQMWQDFLSGGRRSLSAATAAYALIYLGLAFFPYDFVISSNEFLSKLNSNNLGWILSNWTEGPARILVKLVAESIAIAPLGILIGLLASQINLRRTFLAGFFLGLLLECLQFLLVSGVSQGASALMRGLGLVTGVLIGKQVQKTSPLFLARRIRRLSVFILPFYLLAIATASGWLRMPLLSLNEALSKIPDVHLMPFYYHYYTTEPVAMASLLANLTLYAPIGILIWARHATIPSAKRRGLSEPVLWAALLALLIETTKIWLSGAHPDPSNLLIGAMGAALTYLLVNWLALTSQHQGDQQDSSSKEIGFEKTTPKKPKSAYSIKHRIISFGALALLTIGAWDYPYTAMSLLLAAYAAFLWRQPWSWLFILPALLPVFNFAPFTGRLLLDEFDLLVLVTLGLGYWRILPNQIPHDWANKAYQIGTGLLLVSALVSTLIGLWPLLQGAQLSFSSSHSPLEALMLGKGIFWVLLLIPLFRRIPGQELVLLKNWLINGLAMGLVILSLLVLLERHIFVGISNIDNVFRVTGTFFSMYNGGAYIEAFIAIAFPALAIWTLQQKKPLLRLGGLVMAALASYAMLVTFSRGGYAGLAAGLGVVIYQVWRSRSQFTLTKSLLVAMVLAVGMAAAPVFFGSFAQDRLGKVWDDLQIRLNHWQGAIDLMDPGLRPILTGMGLGRYSDTYLWGGKETLIPGTFSLQQEQGNRYLRLGSGDAFYLDQIVLPSPGKEYKIQAQVRFSDSHASLNIPLCEKALLYSFHCNDHRLSPPTDAAPKDWHEISVALSTKGMHESKRWPKRTLKLSLANPREGGAVDIRSISVTDAEGRNLLKNGDFNNGLTHWLPSTDRDIAWHIHQTALEVYFAQGLLGLLASVILLLAAALALRPHLRKGDPFAIALAGGLIGFMTVSLLGSTLDTTRLNFIFYYLAFSGSLLLITGKTPLIEQNANQGTVVTSIKI